MGLVSHSRSASLTWLKMPSCSPEWPYHFASPGVWCGLEDRKWRSGEVKWLTSDHKANEEMWVRVLENCEFPVLHTFIKLRFECSFHILQENGFGEVYLFVCLLIYWSHFTGEETVGRGGLRRQMTCPGSHDSCRDGWSLTPSSCSFPHTQLP